MNTIVTELHDAELISLRHETKTKTVELIFLTTDAQYLTFVLHGVTQLRCTDFGLQNVVFQLNIHGVNEVLTENTIRSNVVWLFANDSGEQLANFAEIEAVVQQVLERRVLLIVMTPSWGAQIVALAERIS